MPSLNKKIKIKGKKRAEIFEKVSHEIDRFLEKDSVVKLEFKPDPSDKNIEVVSSYVNGKILCRDEEVVIDLKLSLLALPFQGNIERGIDRWIQRSFFPETMPPKESLKPSKKNTKA